MPAEATHSPAPAGQYLAERAQAQSERPWELAPQLSHLLCARGVKEAPRPRGRLGLAAVLASSALFLRMGGVLEAPFPRPCLRAAQE